MHAYCFEVLEDDGTSGWATMMAAIRCKVMKVAPRTRSHPFEESEDLIYLKSEPFHSDHHATKALQKSSSLSKLLSRTLTALEAGERRKGGRERAEGREEKSRRPHTN